MRPPLFPRRAVLAGGLARLAAPRRALATCAAPLTYVYLV
jgi:hypothetical protein